MCERERYLQKKGSLNIETTMENFSNFLVKCFFFQRFRKIALEFSGWKESSRCGIWFSYDAPTVRWWDEFNCRMSGIIWRLSTGDELSVFVFLCFDGVDFDYIQIICHKKSYSLDDINSLSLFIEDEIKEKEKIAKILREIFCKIHVLVSMAMWHF